MGAAEARHGVGVADVAFAHEEVGRVFHQVFDIDGVDRVELGLAERHRQAARLDGNGPGAVADDDDLVRIGGLDGLRAGSLGDGGRDVKDGG